MFRAGKHMLTVIAIFSALLIALSFGGVVRYGDWEGVAISASLSLFVFAITLPLRLEIGPHGIRYRDLRGARSLEFASMTRAYLEMVHSGRRRSLARLSMEAREDRPVRINVRTFDVEAIARLFTALEARAIEIEVLSGAAGVAKQVRAAQASLAG